MTFHIVNYLLHLEVSHASAEFTHEQYAARWADIMSRLPRREDIYNSDDDSLPDIEEVSNSNIFS